MARFKRTNVKTKKKQAVRAVKAVKAPKRFPQEAPMKKEEAKKPLPEKAKAIEPILPSGIPAPGLCQCGEPVASDLGQTDVCKKHIRAN